MTKNNLTMSRIIKKTFLYSKTSWYASVLNMINKETVS